MAFTETNDRIAGFCQAVLYKDRVTTTTGGDDVITDHDVLEGVQSIGVSRSVDREIYQDIGRFQQQYGSYGKHVYTINISRVLNKKRDFFYNVSDVVTKTYESCHILSTETDHTIGCEGFKDRLKNYDLTLIYTPESYSYVGKGGIPPNSNTEVQTTTYRCCLLTNVSYTIPVNGPIVEDLTFVTSVYTQNDTVTITDFTNLVKNYTLDGDGNIQYNEDTGEPITAAGTENGFEHATSIALKGRDINLEQCNFPSELLKLFYFENDPTISGIPIYGLQQIDISIEIGYSDPVDIGQWRGSHVNPYDTNSDGQQVIYPQGAAASIGDGIAGSSANRAQQNLFRQVELPVGVSCTFSGVVRSQYINNASLLEEPPANPDTYVRGTHEITDTYHTAGEYGSETKNSIPEDPALAPLEQYKADREILIVANAFDTDTGADTYLQWNLGKRNYITSFEITGGDADGGNVEASMSFQNDFSEVFLVKDTTLLDFTSTDGNIY